MEAPLQKRFCGRRSSWTGAALQPSFRTLVNSAQSGYCKWSNRCSFSWLRVSHRTTMGRFCASTFDLRFTGFGPYI